MRRRLFLYDTFIPSGGSEPEPEPDLPSPKTGTILISDWTAQNHFQNASLRNGVNLDMRLNSAYPDGWNSFNNTTSPRFFDLNDSVLGIEISTVAQNGAGNETAFGFDFYSGTTKTGSIYHVKVDNTFVLLYNGVEVGNFGTTFRRYFRFRGTPDGISFERSINGGSWRDEVIVSNVTVEQKSRVACVAFAGNPTSTTTTTTCTVARVNTF